MSRISIDDAVRLALEQNLSLQVQRLDPQIQGLNIDLIKTAWTPVVSGTVTNASATSPVSSFFAGATDALTNDRFGAAVQADQLLPWGADYNVTWNNTRAKSNSVYDSPNPALGSGLSGSYTQPLLRNFKIDSTRQQLLVGKKNQEMTDVQLRQTVITTVRQVKYAYWNLAYALENLKVQQQSLDIARESLRNNKSRVGIGTMAPIDIVEAEAEVARNEEAVIIAEAQITRAEDALRALIFDPKNPDFWSTTFDLTDPPAFRAQDVDLDAAVKRALENRTDLVNMRKSLEASDINIRYFKNQILPDLNVRAGYGLTGQGGTNYTFSDTFPPVPISIVDNGWGSVYSQMLSNDFHNWSLAVTVGYPIGRSGAEAALRARQGLVRAGSAAAPQPRADGRHPGARSRPHAEHQPQARRRDAGLARSGPAAARRRAEEVPGRTVDELPRHPGAARPRVGPQRRAAGDPRLQPVRRRLRNRPGGPGRGRRHLAGRGRPRGTGP